ncbi:MAG TPA: hypothetical protein H9669_09255, partial [Firmicutes bacterium]|nr:hypothetical protein [Bacillota bacterium]
MKIINIEKIVGLCYNGFIKGRGIRAMQKKLTIPDQIALMKAEGIGFHIIDETEAEAYITENTVYFKIKTF